MNDIFFFGCCGYGVFFYVVRLCWMRFSLLRFVWIVKEMVVFGDCDEVCSRYFVGCHGLLWVGGCWGFRIVFILFLGVFFSFLELVFDCIWFFVSVVCCGQVLGFIFVITKFFIFMVRVRFNIWLWSVLKDLKFRW